MTEASAKIRGLSARASRVVPASPAEIYRAFTDPTLATAWWGKTEKAEVAGYEIAARSGGTFHFRRRTAKGADEVSSGEFVEVNPLKLVFTWRSPGSEPPVEDSHVTMELLDLKDGSTRVVVTHEGLPTPTAANARSAGWHDMLQDMSLHFAAA